MARDPSSALDDRLVELLFEDELSSEEAEALREALTEHPEAAQRLDAWRQVLRLTEQVPEVEPDPQVHYEILRAARAAADPAQKTERRGFFAWLESLMTSPMLAAAGLMVVVAGSSFLLLRESSDNALQPAKSVSAPAATEKTALVKDQSATKKPEARTPTDKLDPAKPAFGRAEEQPSPVAAATPPPAVPEQAAAARLALEPPQPNQPAEPDPQIRGEGELAGSLEGGDFNLGNVDGDAGGEGSGVADGFAGIGSRGRGIGASGAPGGVASGRAGLGDVGDTRSDEARNEVKLGGLKASGSRAGRSVDSRGSSNRGQASRRRAGADAKPAKKPAATPAPTKSLEFEEAEKSERFANTPKGDKPQAEKQREARKPAEARPRPRKAPARRARSRDAANKRKESRKKTDSVDDLLGNLDSNRGGGGKTSTGSTATEQSSRRFAPPPPAVAPEPPPPPAPAPDPEPVEPPADFGGDDAFADEELAAGAERAVAGEPEPVEEDPGYGPGPEPEPVAQAVNVPAPSGGAAVAEPMPEPPAEPPPAVVAAEAKVAESADLEEDLDEAQGVRSSSLARPKRPSKRKKLAKRAAGPVRADALAAARSARQRGRLREAVQSFEVYLSANRGRTGLQTVFMETAEAYEAMGDFNRAMQLYRLVAQQGGSMGKRAMKKLNRLERNQVEARRQASPKNSAPAAKPSPPAAMDEVEAAPEAAPASKE